ncbi:probable glycosyltransferase [Tanacetum coccineum]
MLAFYAGAMNSRVRESLVHTWINDTEISVHQKRLNTPYSESLLGSKFCLHAKGFEVNTARIGDAIYYGCVPVVLADYYDLPFADILNWSSFAVVVSTGDIAFLKTILKKSVESSEYMKLQKNVIKVQKHFQWHKKPVDFDTFYMVMYELWLRRNSIRIRLFS